MNFLFWLKWQSPPAETKILKSVFSKNSSKLNQISSKPRVIWKFKSLLMQMSFNFLITLSTCNENQWFYTVSDGVQVFCIFSQTEHCCMDVGKSPCIVVSQSFKMHTESISLHSSRLVVVFVVVILCYALSSHKYLSFTCSPSCCFYITCNVLLYPPFFKLHLPN